MRYLLCILLLAVRLHAAPTYQRNTDNTCTRNCGTFNKIGYSGVPAMHAALMPNGKIMFLDKVEKETMLKTWDNTDSAYSSEFSLFWNDAEPLGYTTNAFCAGGTFLANGTLLSMGGNNGDAADPLISDGLKGLRYLTRSASDPSLNGYNWIEPADRQLDSGRWYPSAQTMPDGAIFVASGTSNGLDPVESPDSAVRNPTYEVLNPDGTQKTPSTYMELLAETIPYFTYPFIHLLKDGNLFVFADRSSVHFDVANDKVLQKFDDLDGKHRTYPTTGSSVLLPLSSVDDWNPSVLICGGGDNRTIDSETDSTCARRRPLDKKATWEVDDDMPEGRIMVEGILLPDGNVLWVNGAKKGSQGFGLATDPANAAILYSPDADRGKRWRILSKSSIPRLYHSVALLLLDGTVLIAGSNPNESPVNITSDGFPYLTEYRVEVFVPPYLTDDTLYKRPTTDVELSTHDLKADSSEFTVTFTTPPNSESVKVALYHGGFVTHSLHMGQRMLFLDNLGFKEGEIEQKIVVTMPPDNNVTPPGPYVVYVVVDGVPAVGQFVMVA